MTNPEQQPFDPYTVHETSHEENRHHRMMLRYLGGAVAGALILGPAANALGFYDKKPAVEQEAGPSIEEIAQEIIERGPGEDDLQITTSILQDEAISRAVERANEELRSTNDLSYAEQGGQARATLESAREIETSVREIEKRNVRPGDEITTWYDTESGYFVSDTLPEATE